MLHIKLSAVNACQMFRRFESDTFSSENQMNIQTESLKTQKWSNLLHGVLNAALFL